MYSTLKYSICEFSCYDWSVGWDEAGKKIKSTSHPQRFQKESSLIKKKNTFRQYSDRRKIYETGIWLEFVRIFLCCSIFSFDWNRTHLQLNSSQHRCRPRWQHYSNLCRYTFKKENGTKTITDTTHLYGKSSMLHFIARLVDGTSSTLFTGNLRRTYGASYTYLPSSYQ